MLAHRALFAAIACGTIAASPVLAAPAVSVTDMARWQTQAANVSIARDTWGIPHVRGKTDADAVFGLMYAQPFDDAQPSLPVPYASGNWGALAAYGQSSKSADSKQRRIYGERGNSFVAAMEFGLRIKAKSILAGGQSGDPKSPHFQDQAVMYARAEFKDVLFYLEQVEQHLQHRYRPGE